jgi:hypothetical protein
LATLSPLRRASCEGRRRQPPLFRDAAPSLLRTEKREVHQCHRSTEERHADGDPPGWQEGAVRSAHHVIAGIAGVTVAKKVTLAGVAPEASIRKAPGTRRRTRGLP